MMQPNISTYLAKQLEILLHLMTNVQGEPKGRQVHALRVAARRLQAALWLTHQANNRLALGKGRKALRGLLKQLSRRRELDVAIADARTYDMDTKALRKHRRKASASVKKYLNKSRRTKIQRRVTKAVTQVQAAALPDLFRPIAKLRRELKDWLASPPQQEEQYHDMRLSLKKTRYALEALGQPAISLKPLQEQLGRLHDLQILRSYLGNNPGIAKDEVAARASADKLVGAALSEALTHLSVMSGSPLASVAAAPQHDLPDSPTAVH